MGVGREGWGLAEVHGARLAYQVAGAGEPIVLLHAGIADSRMWDEIVPALAERCRVVRFDARGFGRSSLPDAPFSSANDVAGLLAQLDLGPAVLIGASLGGATALDVALERPELVTALVLVAPGLGGSEPSPAMRAAWDEIDAIRERAGVAAAVEAELRLWVDGPHRTPDQVDPAVREQVRVMNAAIFEAVAPAGATRRRLDPPAIARLGQVRVPTLVVVGDGDVPDCLANAATIARGVAGARLVTMPGVAHLPSMERPTEFTRLVLEFLAARREWR